MNPNLPIQGSQATSQAGSSAPNKVDPRNGAQFRALLDRLQQETTSLQQTSESLVDPSELSGAVDQARHTIEDARSLGDQLLEAYRAARQLDQEGSRSA